MKITFRKPFVTSTFSFLIISSYFYYVQAQNMASSKSKDVVAFEIAISKKDVKDLKDRLKASRWPDAVNENGWDYGTNLPYMKSLVDYWIHQYDWQKQQAQLNKLKHYKADIDGVNVHFIHQAGQIGRASCRERV